MPRQFNEEILCCKERLQLNLNRYIFRLGILVDTLKIIVLNKFAWAFVVTKEVMNSPVGRTAIGIVSPVAVGLGTYAVKRYMRNAQYTLPEGVHGPVYKEPWSWADVSKYIANPAKKK